MRNMRTKITPEQVKPLTLHELEAEHLSDVLEFTGGNKSQAAQLLGIERRTLYRMLARHEAKAMAGEG